MTDQEFSKAAIEHDVNLQLAIAKFSQSVTEIGKELAIMRDEKLWRYVRDPETDGSHRGCFKTWREYASARLGPIAQSSMYEYISAATLTEGKKPVPAVTIDELGVKKAAQVARLPESKRTKKLLKQVKKASVKEAKQLVDAVLAAEIPKDERKAAVVSFSINLPQEVIDLIDEVEHSGQFLESVRDNDRTWTLRAKLWHQVWWYFLDSHKEELKAAEQYRNDFLAAKGENPTSQSIN
jgi:hypothetical protein